MTDPLPDARGNSRALSAGLSRREFVAGVTALGAVWLTACSAPDEKSATSVPATPAMPPEAPAPPQRLVHFTAAQAAEVEAMTARLIPSDDGPGAKEAGAVFFIDNGLAGMVKEQAPLFANGLQTVAKAVAKQHGAGAKFSTLTTAQQDAILTGIERTEFFGALRFATIAGFLSLPRYGGNKDYVGWQYIGQQHTHEHTAPFGWYDDPVNQQALLGRVL